MIGKKKGFYNDPKLINLPFFFLANSITHHKSKESTKTNLIREIQKVLIHLFFLLGEKKKLSLKLVVKIKSCLKISTRPKKKKTFCHTIFFVLCLLTIKFRTISSQIQNQNPSKHNNKLLYKSKPQIKNSSKLF